ncbi:Orn/Lys/Arg decarboxylase N-terminal domain-containing protein [Escherichia coli]
MRVCAALFLTVGIIAYFELCEEISKMNENLPLYAFANTYSTLNVSLNDLRLQISFFEYALGAAEDIANKIKQTTDEDIFNTILPPLTKALFDLFVKVNILSVLLVTWAVLHSREKPVGHLSMISLVRIP